MTLYRLKNSDMAAEAAIQFDGRNAAECSKFSGRIEVIAAPRWRAEGLAPLEQSFMLADPEFPCWLEPGDWLTRNDAGEVDVWPAAAFADRFEAFANDAPATPAKLPSANFGRSTAILEYMSQCRRNRTRALSDVFLDERSNELWKQAQQIGWVEFDEKDGWILTAMGRQAAAYASVGALK